MMGSGCLIKENIIKTATKRSHLLHYYCDAINTDFEPKHANLTIVSCGWISMLPSVCLLEGHLKKEKCHGVMK